VTDALLLTCPCGWRDASTSAATVSLFDATVTVFRCPTCGAVLAGVVGPDLTSRQFAEHPDFARLCGMEAGAAFVSRIALVLYERLTSLPPPPIRGTHP
jgi:predicted RNA-binding Zn-ribbon protein involved in translation (DUF1610 family)